MAIEPSSPAVERSRQSVQRPVTLSRRVWIFIVGWLVGWPVLVFAATSLITHPHWLYLFPFVAGGILWLVSWYCVCGTLLSKVQARWPATKPIKEFVEFVFTLLRSLHHSL